jgi:roadblock/LC7 domain-containing protein
MMLANARSVNVKRTELLEKLKANRDKHNEDYLLAFAGYRIEVVKVLEAALAKAQKNEFDEGLLITEDPPENHTGDYDQVIAMMEMSVDEHINLDAQSFSQYVLDNWMWKQNFAVSSAKYITNVSGHR